MFKFNELSEQDRAQEATSGPDFQLTGMQLKITNLGSMIKGSKRLYHWTFDARRPDGEWKFVSVMLTDSSFSKKKTLAVNDMKVIDKEKL